MEPYVAAEGGGGGGGRGGGPGTDTGLEESMWRLGLGGGEEEEAAAAAAAARLPERPGEADCVYYLRTGACGYGENCRYNHPRDRAAAAFNGGEKNMRSAEYPERPGQPVCEYYMKNGTCKFGSNCKYDHPREGSVQPVILNASGYPLRPGEKDCSHYMKTGHCKFGTTCKFHHPEIGGFVDTANMYPPVQPPPMSSSHPYPHLASWQMGRPPVLPGSFLSSSYPPMMLPSTVIPMQGWSPYISPVNQVASAGGHQTVQAGPLYGLSQQGPSSAVAYGSQFAPLSSSAVLSSSSKQEPAFPARPGQPECQYYLKTGSCKFGSACKYHHPQCLGAPKSNCMLSPLGLPLRPGSLPCAYYTQHGFCKFGPTCKFDHPMGTLSYSPSASSLTDVPIGPYPLGFTVAPMAPLSSSSDMQPDYLITKELLANQSAPPGSACVPAGAMVKAYASHMLIRPQTSAAGGIVTSHGREL